jgi:hypothetical protein
VTRLGLRSLALLIPLLVACSSGGSAGPGAGGAGGSAGGGSGGGAGAGAAGTGGGGTSANAGNGGAAGSNGGGGASGSGAGGGTTGSAGATAGNGGSGGATAGNGGSAGATAGSGGSTGVGGATGGSGGTSGSGGAAGARGGSGGAGGATGTAGTGGASGIRLEYQNSSATNTTFSVRLTNLGPATPLISVIKVRYYFRDDDSPNHDAAPLVAVAQWKLAGTTTTIDLRMTPGCTTATTYATPPLSSYVDFGCAWTAPMGVQDVITFTLALNPPSQLAANDYSYADTAGAFAPNDHLLVLVNGSVQSGTPP